MVYVRKARGSKGALRPLQQLQHTPVQACAVAGGLSRSRTLECIACFLISLVRSAGKPDGFH